ncbi:hypothetical protein GQ53DRAFT_837877 [Thozetella sp. PMI_491]|nr:hypothetical protein GQ53DRAFT_837877 [Thozetella sp. PMI_491]
MGWFGSSSTRGDILRPLGNSERFMSAIHLLGLHVGVILSCRYRISAGYKQVSIKEAVEVALACTVLQHPLLQVGLLREDSAAPAWIRLNSIDLGYHVEWIGVKDASDEAFEEAFRDAVQPLVSSPFPDLETRPGWRVVVFRDPEDNKWIEVLFAFSHANCDGLSGKIFHDDFLKYLGNLPESQNAKLLLKDGILGLPPLTPAYMTPPQEKLLDFTVSAPWALGSLWAELKPPMLATKADAAWMPIRSDLPPSPRWRVFTVGAEEMARILEACRENSTTFTPLLHAVTFVAFAGQVSQEQAPTFLANTPISLRRFIRRDGVKPDRLIGNLITRQNHRFDTVLVKEVRQKLQERDSESASEASTAMEYLERTVWEEAGRVRRELLLKLEQGVRNDQSSLMGLVSDARDYFKQNIKKTRKLTWDVTNVGTIERTAPEQSAGLPETWSVEKMLFTQSTCETEAGYYISVAGVKGGSVCVSCIWKEGVLSDDMGHGISKRMEDQLVNLGTQGKIFQ